MIVNAVVALLCFLLFFLIPKLEDRYTHFQYHAMAALSGILLFTVAVTFGHRESDVAPYILGGIGAGLFYLVYYFIGKYSEMKKRVERFDQDYQTLKREKENLDILVRDQTDRIRNLNELREKYDNWKTPDTLLSDVNRELQQENSRLKKSMEETVKTAMEVIRLSEDKSKEQP